MLLKEQITILKDIKHRLTAAADGDHTPKGRQIRLHIEIDRLAKVCISLDEARADLQMMVIHLQEYEQG